MRLVFAVFFGFIAEYATQLWNIPQLSRSRTRLPFDKTK